MNTASGTQRPRVLLGIDPGLRITGYGLLTLHGGMLGHLDHGSIRTRPGDHAQRLLQIHLGVRDLLEKWQVDELAIEKQFVALNPASAFAVGEARAVCMLAAAMGGVPVFEYAPTEVKQAVTSFGRSRKDQVQEMVRMRFGLPEAPQPADAADALATAVCHAAVRGRPEATVRL